MDKFAKTIAVSWDGDGDGRWRIVWDKPDDVATVGMKTRVGIYKLVEVVDVTAKTVVSRRRVRSR